MWTKWNLRRSCTNHNLTSYKNTHKFLVVLLLVSCYLYVTSEPRATHMQVFHRAKWVSDGAMWANCQTSHASSVMANYNWQLMLESGQAQTKASWQNNPDHQRAPESWHYPAISTHPEVRARHRSCHTSQDINGTLSVSLLSRSLTIALKHLIP